MRLPIRNVGFNFAGQLLPMVVALVAMPVLVRHAGAERLGFLGLAWALIGYFALLDLGLSRVVTRRVAVADSMHLLGDEVEVVKRLCVQLFVAVACISAVLSLAVPAHVLVGKNASPALTAEAGAALWILWATLPFTVVTGLLRGGLEGLQEFGRANLLRAFFGAWSFGAPILVLVWSKELGPLTAAIAVGRVLSFFAHATWALKALHAHERAHRDRAVASMRSSTPAARPTIVELFREGGWLTVSNIVGPMMVTFDRFAIASLVSIAAASYYFVPQEVSLRMLVIPSAIATTIFPMLARTDGQFAVHRRLTENALQAVAATCLPLCAVIAMFAHPLLSAWMGSGFAEASAAVAACLATGLFANCCAQVPFAWIQASGRSDITGKMHLVQLPIYVVLLILLTLHYGIVGAAIAWSLRAVLDAAMLFIASSSLFPQAPLVSTLQTLVIGLILLTLLGGASLMSGSLLRWTFSSLLLLSCVGISAALAWRLRLSIAR